MTPLLEHWLSRYYAAKVLRKGNLKTVTTLLRQRFEADASLAAEGKTELNRCSSIPDNDAGQRCFVSKTFREALLATLPHTE